MYVMFVALHAKIAMTIYRIGLRYHLLNKCIRNYEATGRYIEWVGILEFIEVKCETPQKNNLKVKRNRLKIFKQQNCNAH